MRWWERWIWSVLTIFLTAILLIFIFKKDFEHVSTIVAFFAINIFVSFPILWMTQDMYAEIARRENVRRVLLNKHLFIGFLVGFLVSFSGMIIPYSKLNVLIPFVWLINHFGFWVLFFTRIRYLKCIF